VHQYTITCPRLTPRPPHLDCAPQHAGRAHAGVGGRHLGGGRPSLGTVDDMDISVTTAKLAARDAPRRALTFLSFGPDPLWQLELLTDLSFFFC
jgi:hypothetical protein